MRMFLNFEWLMVDFIWIEYFSLGFRTSMAFNTSLYFSNKHLKAIHNVSYIKTCTLKPFIETSQSIAHTKQIFIQTLESPFCTLSLALRIEGLNVFVH